jgi:hypothetical protein
VLISKHIHYPEAYSTLTTRIMNVCIHTYAQNLYFQKNKNRF